MRKSHLYIFQLFGIIVLICGYLLSDQPDSLSLMYFNPSSPKTISCAGSRTSTINCAKTILSSQEQPSKSNNYSKHFSSDVILPIFFRNQYAFSTQPAKITSTFCEGYYFQFFREINPPPPKC